MNFRTLLQENVTSAEELREPLHLSQEEYEAIREEITQFPMSVTKYYLSLINPDDPDDPIRKMAIPAGHVVFLDGELDTSGEHSNTKARGLQHKYAETALVLVTSECAMYCRHCFRRRLVGLENEEIAADPREIVRYIKEHPSISNVLLSGGDSFLLDTEKIEEWLSALKELDQLDFIRFGTRSPVTFPQRILEDPGLTALLERYTDKKQIYVVTHFNHPNEITDLSAEAVHRLQRARVTVKNQTVLLKGINDDPAVLGHLLKSITSLGIVPHYIFQCRPVKGVKSRFQVPIEKGSRIVSQALAMQNGLGKSVDYTMSHVTGKIRILGTLPDGKMLFQYKQAKNPELIGKIFTREMGDETWLPDPPFEAL